MMLYGEGRFSKVAKGTSGSDWIWDPALKKQPPTHTKLQTVQLEATRSGGKGFNVPADLRLEVTGDLLTCPLHCPGRPLSAFLCLAIDSFDPVTELFGIWSFGTSERRGPRDDLTWADCTQLTLYLGSGAGAQLAFPAANQARPENL